MFSFVGGFFWKTFFTLRVITCKATAHTLELTEN